MEVAAGRRGTGGGDVAFETDAVSAGSRIDGGYGGEEGLGVGMERLVEERLGGALLHDAAEIHDGHLVGRRPCEDRCLTQAPVAGPQWSHKWL